MALTLRHEVLSLKLRDPFRIARADHGEGLRVTTIIVELRHPDHSDVVGVGEGFPDAFYGETPATMATVMPWLLERIEAVPFEPTIEWLRKADELADSAIRGHGAAKCAIDIALHDLVGRILGVPVHDLLGRHVAGVHLDRPRGAHQRTVGPGRVEPVAQADLLRDRRRLGLDARRAQLLQAAPRPHLDRGVEIEPQRRVREDDRALVPPLAHQPRMLGGDAPLLLREHPAQGPVRRHQ